MTIWAGDVGVHARAPGKINLFMRVGDEPFRDRLVAPCGCARPIEEGEPLVAVPARRTAHGVVADPLGSAPHGRAHASTVVVADRARKARDRPWKARRGQRNAA